MKTIFISRDLNAQSFFLQKMKAAGFTVHGKSLLNFSAVSFNRIPKTDWIFFYSKNGVKFFFKGLKESSKKISAHIQWAAIGKATSKALFSQTQQIDFTGNGNTLQTASQFLKLANRQSVLFPQAKNSKKTIERILDQYITSKELIVYNNEPKKRFTLPDCSILVFTSPMNAKAYFKNRALSDDQKVYAIGRTTAKTLVGIGIKDFLIAEEPSEEALVKAILEL